MAPASSSAAQLLFTSCGTVVCSNCCKRGTTNNCPACRGPCRTVGLNRRAPTDVLRLFKDPSDLIKELFKILEFQESQKSRFLSFHHQQKGCRISLITESHNKKVREEAVLSQLKADLKNLEIEERGRKATLGKEIERRRESGFGPRSGDGVKRNSDKFLFSRGTGDRSLDPLNDRSLDRPTPLVDCFGGIGNGSLDSVMGRGGGGNRGGLNTTGRSDGVMSGVFQLQMKTPGGWEKHQKYGLGGRGQSSRREVKNTAQVLRHLSTSAERRLVKMNSPLSF